MKEYQVIKIIKAKSIQDVLDIEKGEIIQITLKDDVSKNKVGFIDDDR